MAKSKKRAREEMRALIKELEGRPPADDVVVFARRSNALRLQQLEELSVEIGVLEGLEQSSNYDPEAIERAAKIIALQHGSIAEDIQLEIEALKKYYEETPEEENEKSAES